MEVSVHGCLPGGVCQSECLPVGAYLAHGIVGKQTSPVNRMTDMCKNITLPHTSYAVLNIYNIWN